MLDKVDALKIAKKLGARISNHSRSVSWGYIDCQVWYKT